MLTTASVSGGNGLHLSRGRDRAREQTHRKRDGASAFAASGPNWKQGLGMGTGACRPSASS